MAKSGLDYFPLDVTLDNKFELIEAEFGLTGFGVIVHLLQEIYGQEGYYIEWKTEVALLFSRKYCVGGSVVSEIVSAAIRRGMFDKEIYDKYQILTSVGVQKRYFEAVSRRKEIKVKDNILLVNVAQICKNVDIKRENVNIFDENVNIPEQSKGKESKVEERKEKIYKREKGTKTDRFIKPTLEEVTAYCKERDNGIDPEAFMDYYIQQKWRLSNGNPMVDWKAAVRTWERRRREGRDSNGKSVRNIKQSAERKWDLPGEIVL